MRDRLFHDRRDAGRVLAAKLSAYAHRSDVTVLALPRGGVPVGYEVARALHAPLDVFLVRKLGVPGQGEFAMGAIAAGGVQVLNQDMIELLGLRPDEVGAVVLAERQELARREHVYRAGRPALQLEGRTVVVVDDGLATGSTMRAAVEALRAMAPARIVVAVPVAAAETCQALRAEADTVVCASTPEPFHAVGAWYEDFAQTEDGEVRELLDASALASG